MGPTESVPNPLTDIAKYIFYTLFNVCSLNNMGTLTTSPIDSIRSFLCQLKKQKK